MGYDGARTVYNFIVRPTKIIKGADKNWAHLKKHFDPGDAATWWNK